MNTLTTFQWLCILTAIICIKAMYIWNTYNSFIRSRNRLKTDYSDIDIQIKRRASLIERLADIVKAYAKHEKETFEGVAKARSAVDTSSTTIESAQADNMLTQTLRSLFSVVESYPTLKANENFLSLRDDLKMTENLIAEYREEYNKSVLAYNNTVLTFPNLIVAAIFGFHEEQLFAEHSN